MSPAPAALLLAAAGTAALVADRLWAVATIAAVLLAVCLRAPVDRRRVYLFGALTTGLGVFLLSPFLWSSPDGTVLWEGPTIPVLGPLDVTTTELYEAALNALRLTALGLAFAAYALLLDHDRLVAAAGGARRSALAVALATRLVPSLERDAVGLAESVRGRGRPARGRARLRDAALAARRRLARAGVEPRGGDGGARLRPYRRDPGAAARPGARATGWRCRSRPSSSWWRRCGSSAPSTGSRSRTRPRRRRCGRSRSSSSRARSSRCSVRPAPASRRCSVRSPGSCLTSTVAASRAASSSPASTRGVARPAMLAGTVATVFQDPEDQVVMSIAANEVAFGLENLGVPPARDLAPRRAGSRGGRRAPPLGAQDGRALRRRAAARLPRLRARARALSCSSSTSRPRSSTRTRAALFLAAVERLGATVVISEHRVARALELATRVLFVEDGRVLLDAPRAEAVAWLDAERPLYTRSLC